MGGAATSGASPFCPSPTVAGDKELEMNNLMTDKPCFFEKSIQQKVSRDTEIESSTLTNSIPF